MTTLYKYLLWSLPVLFMVIVGIKLNTDDTTITEEPSPQTIKPSAPIVNPEKSLKDPHPQLPAQGYSSINPEGHDIALPTESQAPVKLPDAKEIEIRQQEEQRLKKEDKSYKQQAKQLAIQYEETAKRVAENGGDPKPLLDAANYYENESK